MKGCITGGANFSWPELNVTRDSISGWQVGMLLNGTQGNPNVIPLKMPFPLRDLDPP